MGYQALYRKWRPQRFDEMVGQDAVAQTLEHAVASDKISHAYLFTGPRGTGKTSAAKILAKAVNCPNQVNGEPCNECDICRGITSGVLSDVIEIDAASNNGVDEIRDIRDKVRYAPTEAPNKVYIIDEVHMLSSGAFNALLKTLEEPPAHVVFILATTEWQKIPATVISRTQRFNFRRIDQPTLIARMQTILDAEGVDYEPDALTVIAHAANGGMRDALSILDQLLSFTSDQLTKEAALELTGALGSQQKIAYMQAIAAQQTEDALAVLREAIQAGREPARFVEELLYFTRDLLLAQSTPEVDREALLAGYDDDFYALAQDIDATFLYQVMQQLEQARYDMQYSVQPVIYLEVATISLAEHTGNHGATQGPADDTVADLQREVTQLKQLVETMQTNGGTPSSASPSRSQRPSHTASKGKNFEPNFPLIYRTLANATKKDRNDVLGLWPDLVEQLPKVQRTLLQQTEPVAASEDYFVLAFEYATFCRNVSEDQEIQVTVKTQIGERLGHPKQMLVLTVEQWQDARKKYVQALKNGTSDALTAGAGSDKQASDDADHETFDVPDETAEVVEPLADVFGKDNIHVVDD
ncbi:MAG: DNA polymerase III subunit gamma/tau [Aerococcus sp.]|nr:DNA polymerase III subunit gamma/tau [Aerococcus sp.]